MVLHVVVRLVVVVPHYVSAVVIDRTGIAEGASLAHHIRIDAVPRLVRHLTASEEYCGKQGIVRTVAGGKVIRFQVGVGAINVPVGDDPGQSSFGRPVVVDEAGTGRHREAPGVEGCYWPGGVGE